MAQFQLSWRPPRSDHIVVTMGLVADLIEGVPSLVKVQGREIALIRWRGEVFALRNICPHQSVSFEKGITHGLITAGQSVGQLTMNEEEPVIVCPRHTYEYVLRTGRCVSNPNLRAKSYPVTVTNGHIFVNVDREEIRGQNQ
jgi:nitrite reductase/ring-hydroxylating ferredoxin subunit